MAVPRDCLDSRMSAASTGTSMLLDRQHGNCLEMVRDLYTILEPQLCKSYRTNVKYTPPAHPVDFQQHTLHPPHFDRRKHKAVKTARIVIEAVNQFQSRPDHSSSTPKPKATLDPGKLATKEKSDVKLDGKLATKEKSDVKLDGKLAAKETSDVKLGGKLATKEKSDVKLDGKLATKEKSDVKLDGKLAAKETSDVKLDGSKESSQSLPNLTVN